MASPTRHATVLRRLWHVLPHGLREELLILQYGATGPREPLREVMNRDIDRFLASLPAGQLCVAGVSGHIANSPRSGRYTL